MHQGIVARQPVARLDDTAQNRRKNYICGSVYVAMHLEKHCHNPILVMKRQSGAANVESLVTKTMDFFFYIYKKWENKKKRSVYVKG